MSVPSTVDVATVDVAIIGGGIAGLSAAWYIQQKAQEQGAPIRYALLESAPHWGGKIVTEEVPVEGHSPFVVEGGPDSFITQKPWALQLARELGLQEELLSTNDEQRQVFVLKKGKPTPLPDGVMLIVPTRFAPFVFSPLISPLGKLRMGMELFVPAKQDNEDETLAQFIRRRLGAEALDRIAEPLMSGIYNAEAERQSLLATFPRFRELEQKHGSLTKGMLAARKARGAQPAATNGQPRLSTFVSFRRGMGQLVDALQTKLTGDCRLDAAVQRIERRAESGYRLHFADGEQIDAQQVILTIPAYHAATLLRPIAPEAAEKLDGIRYVSTGTMSLGFQGDTFSHPLNGFGVVIPRSEERRINAITWSSTKFPQRAPENHVLLRVFFGGSRTPEMMAEGDDELLAAVRAELQEIMGITTPPLFHRICRWHDANPQYDVGHLERVAAIEAALPAGIHVTGSPYRGIGIPDCVHQAEQTAARVVVEEPIPQ